jgi:hypothetical protein
MVRRFGLPMIAVALLIACATIFVASRDFDNASVQLVQVQIPLSVTEKLRHAVRKQPRDPAAYWPVFPQLYVFAKCPRSISLSCFVPSVFFCLAKPCLFPHRRAFFFSFQILHKHGQWAHRRQRDFCSYL